MNAENEFNPFRISKYDLDLLIHCCQSASDKQVLIFERTDDPKAMIESAKQQQKYVAYAHVWQVRFGSLWMQKIAWEGKVLESLTEWYKEHDPLNAPKVDERVERAKVAVMI